MPPELKLEAGEEAEAEGDLARQMREGLHLDEAEPVQVLRKGSLDMNYSIIEFITRRIR